ncbi:Ubiquitin-conjugating enzyme E2 D2B [Frankliniella fusca]|uniref:Ubiquitin-conjugating enzyme E2 D2B n=1 Tax=Frankliniella fusca TaxID=407009 RepID=A0AAE1LPP7_9NEOP|nr:Ubiquitin-conjugating enzyme E2 D2B [Frankliniella fusca]
MLLLKRLSPKGENMLEWDAAISGPSDSPYEGGTFQLLITIPDGYPLCPPKVKFITRIYHPNISSSGYICLSILKSSASGSEGKWVPGTTLSMLMVAIRSLLTDPNLDDPIVPSIAKEKADTPEVFCFKAKKWTEKYAK